MAAGADPAAASCAKALAAFVERGKALLERAEIQSREGRQHFVQHVKIDAVTYSWLVIYQEQEACQSLDVKNERREDCYTLTSFTFAYAGSPQDFIRQKIRIEQKQSLLGLIEAAADLYRRLRALTTLYKTASATAKH